MNILLFMPYTATPSNGFQSVSYNLLQGLLKRQAELENEGLNIHLFSAAGSSLIKREYNVSNSIKIINYKYIPPQTILGDLQNFVRVLGKKKLLNNIHLVHSHDLLFTSPAVLTFKKPLIHNFHGLPWKEKQLTRSKFSKFSSDTMIIRNKLIRDSINLKFVCISPYVFRELKNFLDVPDDAMEVIPDPVSEDFFYIGKIEKPGLIFYPARLIPRKNHIALIKALAILKKEGFSKFALALTGVPEDVGYYKELNEIIRKYDLKNEVTFLGKIPRSKLLDLYTQASIVILTSLEETFSLVVGEAMATGTPVIASPVGIVVDAIENGRTGFIINPSNPRDIAEKIYLLLNDANLRKKVGLASRAVAKQWLPERVAENLIDFWLRTVEF